jgi:16S rRNA (guanine527-N7)-methyltransferase
MPAMTEDTESLPSWLSVSRETHSKLREHLNLVRKWTSAVNLVSPSSIGSGWQRHVLDSAQVWLAARVKHGVWVDIGSGAGFPGLVAAIIAEELAPEVSFVMVESDRRKATFLREAARLLSLPVSVHAERIEALGDLSASVLSARALAPLNSLVSVAHKMLAPKGIGVFPKGQSFEEEMVSARSNWEFVCETIRSKTDPQSVILRIENVRHV